MRVMMTVTGQRALAPNVYEMKLEGDTSPITAPGQFVNIMLEGHYLRRPISVCDVTGNTLTLIYKVVGAGTRQMATLPEGTTLDILSGLGNGFTPCAESRNPLLVGGGVGVPPLYLLAKRLTALGQKPTVVLGFNTKDEVFYREEFAALGCHVVITTADGSMGIKGFVTHALPELDYDYTYACGPEPMLRALYGETAVSGQYSFEERMACGFGACMGCSCKTKYGNKRICTDGPVLVKEEIIW